MMLKADPVHPLCHLPTELDCSTHPGVTLTYSPSQEFMAQYTQKFI